MSRRASGVPQTPIHNDDALERSIRRQQSSNRSRSSISDVMRRVQDSPLHRPPSRSRGGDISGYNSGAQGSQRAEVAPGDFQEWMKMVRTKRVKANNAFAIQLIDAFHSMVQGHVLSQDGQNVTFQEATHTLGGCLTVYKNRIARVKDDTSRLLVGVSENKSSSENAVEDDEDSGNETDDGDDRPTETEKKRKKQQRKKGIGADAFLAPAAKLEIDTNELATSIDPLLRKMSADFDKRGAGALLQYSLKLDKQGRLLLDAEAQEIDEKRPEVPSRSQKHKSVNGEETNRLPLITEEDEDGDSIDDVSAKAESDEELNDNQAGEQAQSAQQSDSDELYLAHFNVNYFANLDLSHRDALPMVDGISRAVLNPIDGTESLINDMQAWALTDPGDSSTYRNQENADGEDGAYDEDNAEYDGLQTENEAGLDGLGLDLQLGGDFKEIDFDDPAGDGYADDDEEGGDLSLNSIVSTRMPTSGNWMDIDHLQSLDAQRTNWAGPSFWKIRRLHARLNDPAEAGSRADSPGDAVARREARAARQMASAATVIDFSQEEDVDLNELFGTSSRSTQLSNKQYDLQNKHLLPVDMHFTTKQLVSLQLRPMTGIAPAFRTGAWKGTLDDGDGTTDHAGTFMNSMDLGNEDGGFANNENDDFFYGGWDDHPDQATMRPTTASAMFTQNTQTGYGLQSNQLNFARVAKRVDVRRLKDNVWKAIHRKRPDAEASDQVVNELENGQIEQENQPEPQNEQTTEPTKPEETTLIQVIQDTQPLYSEQQRSDLSPAMYFISLLHLSNEKGLSLQNTDAFTDIRITCKS